MNRSQISSKFIEALKSDPDSCVLYFSDVASISSFNDLFEIGVFDLDVLPELNRKHEGHSYNIWPQTQYLLKISQQIDKEIIQDPLLISKFRDVLLLNITKTDNPVVVLEIFKSFINLPVRYYTSDNLGIILAKIESVSNKGRFLSFELNKAFEKLVVAIGEDENSKSIIISYLKFLLSIKFKEKKCEFYFFDNHHLWEFKKKYFSDESESQNRNVLPLIFAEIIFEILDQTLDATKSDNLTHFWRPAIEEHNQNNHHDDPEAFLSSSLFQIVSNNIDVVGMSGVITKIKLSSKYTFKRILLALMYTKKESFDVSLGAELILLTGLIPQLKFEIYHFLKINFDSLDENKKIEILGLINGIEVEDDLSSDEKKTYLAWRKIRWLSALKDSNFEEARREYSKCLEVTINEPEHPEFSSYISSGWVGPRSPWSIEDFSKASSDEVLTQLLTFDPNDEHFGPSIEGLARTLEEAIQLEPDKYFILVKSLSLIKPIYGSSVFDGYAKAWKTSNQLVPQQSLLLSFRDLIASSNYEKEISRIDDKRLWLVNSALRFIKAGTIDDNNSFQDASIQYSKEIISLLLTKIVPTGEYVSDSDAYTRAINEPRGVLFETAVVLSLYIARNAEKQGRDRAEGWSFLKEIVEETLSKNDPLEVSFYAILGAYYRQILYLNDSWFFSNLDKFLVFSEGEKQIWESFMEGFAYVNVFVDDVYKSLRDKGIILRFLRNVSGDEGSSTRLNTKMIELSIVAYLRSVDEIDSGVISEIINSAKSDELKKLLGSLTYMLGKKPDPSIRSRAKELVYKIFELQDLVEKEEELVDVYKSNHRVVEIFDDINDSRLDLIIKLLAKSSKSFWDLSDLVEYLHGFIDSNLGAVAKFFKLIVQEAPIVPTYPDKELEEILIALKNSCYHLEYGMILSEYDRKCPRFRILEKIR